MYFRDILQSVLAIVIIGLIISSWHFQLNILKLFAFLILFTWLTILYMNIIRETRNVPKRIFYTVLILTNFYLLTDASLRYT